MAPFKLKFRMGSSSRSTSQETEEPVQQPLLTRQSSICASNTTIDSEFNSMSSNNDQHNLLPNTFNEESGYENPSIMRTITDTRCYQNIHASTDHANDVNPERCTSRDCDKQTSDTVIVNESTSNTGCSVGAQIFLSNPIQSNENLVDSTAGSCDPLFAGQSLEQINLDVDEKVDKNDDQEECSSQSTLENQSEDEWDDDRSQEYNQGTLDTIINNKSSKKIYKAVAKEWGITCKMSENCRCIDCQSNYFDCEYDDNEHQKTDGGMGAATPMFINEVIHGSACTII